MRALFFSYRDALLSGLFLGFAWLHEATYILGFVGVVLLYRFVVTTSSKRQLWLGGTIAWTIKSLCVLSWFFAAYPLAWLPEISSYQAALLITLCWLYVGGVLGLAGGVLAVLTHVLRSRLYLPLLFALLWVGSEYLGSVFFALATAGPGVSLNFGFSFGYIGYVLAEHSLLGQFALVGGVFGLSFIFVLLATLGYEYIRSKTRKQIWVSSAAVLIFLGAGAFSLPAEFGSAGITVATVETNFTASEIRDETFIATRAAEIQQAVRAALANDVDYILLPEGAQLFAGADAATKEALSRFRFLYQDAEVVLIDSTTAYQTDTVILRANIFDGTTKQGWSFIKPELVPNGEYLPYVTRLFSQALLGSGKTDFLKEQISLTAKPNVDRSYPAHLPAVLFCFSGSDPLAVKRLQAAHQGPFIAHPMSHAHFGEAPYLVRQLDQMLRVQAIWNQVPIVSAGNLVESSLYTPFGTQVQALVVEEGVRWRLRLFTL